MSSVHFASTRAARENLSALLTAADEGRPASVQRSADRRLSVVDSARLAHFYRTVHPANAQVISDEGYGVAILLPDLPVHGDGDDLEEAVADTVAALRDYAEDWSDHLRHAPNHQDHYMLVQFVAASTDEELREWIVAG